MALLLFQKGFRDLKARPERAVIVIVALTLGVSGVAASLDAYAILDREIKDNYASTNPASATIHLAGPQEDIPAQKDDPSIAGVEARRELSARFLVEDGHWRPMILFVLADPNSSRIDIVRPGEGAWPPHAGEIVLERSSLPLTTAKIGTNVTVKTAQSYSVTLKFVGLVHAAGMPPGWRAGVVYGYVTMSTLDLLGEPRGFNELRLVVTEDLKNATHISAVASAYVSSLEAQGIHVARVAVPADIAGGRSGPEPGEHPSTNAMRLLMVVLGFFGLMALALSGLLVVTLLSALMVEQTRQIAIMKTVGASRIQLLAIYGVVVLAIAATGLALGMPLGRLAGIGFARFGLRVFNFDLQSQHVPLWATLVQISVGLLLPLAAAAVPVARAVRRPARDSLVDHGVDSHAFGKSALDRWLTRAGGSSRPVALVLRNSIRQKRRLAMTLATLAVAGALFMSAQHATSSWRETIDDAFASRHYDLDVKFAASYPEEKILQAFAGQSGVERVEVWKHVRGNIVLPDHRLAETLWISSPPTPTASVTFPIIEGRWLESTDTNAIVLTPASLKYVRGAEVGSTVELQMGANASSWKVIGIAKELAGPPSVYVARAGLESVFPGASSGVRVLAADRTAQGIATLAGSVEQSAKSHGLAVAGATRTSELRESLDNHVQIVLFLLLLVASLVVVVGGLGLAAVMSVAIIERRREYGVMRALGATSQDLRRLVLAEGLAMAGASWLIAIPLSIAVATAVSSASGRVFLEYPLDFAISPTGIAIWLGVSVLIGSVASLSALRPLLREPLAPTLSYE